MVSLYEGTINKIKLKKELSGVSDSVIESLIKTYESKHRISLFNLKEKEIKLIIKEIRFILRNLSGRFKLNKKSKKLDNSQENQLNTHSSTKERLHFYPELKKIISSLDVKSILDLGCGLNPIALADKSVKYYASDIDEENLSAVNMHFEKNNIKGNTFIHDLKNISEPLPKAELIILFKVIDIIDDKKHHLSEKIITSFKSKYILISFATKKISGKHMRFPRRIWFEKMIKRLNFKYRVFETQNEVFYLLEHSTTLV